MHLGVVSPWTDIICSLWIYVLTYQLSTLLFFLHLMQTCSGCCRLRCSSLHTWQFRTQNSGRCCISSRRHTLASASLYRRSARRSKFSVFPSNYRSVFLKGLFAPNPFKRCRCPSTLRKVLSCSLRSMWFLIETKALLYYWILSISLAIVL